MLDNNLCNENCFLTKWFDALHKRGINYAILRNYQCLPNSCGGSDIDLWVKKSDYSAFLHVTCKIAKECGGMLVSKINDTTCPRLVFLSISWGIQLDVHIGVAQHRGVVYMNNSIIEGHIEDYNGIKVLAPEIDSMISFLKEILNNKKCKDAYCLNASELVCNLSREEIDDYLSAFSQNIREKIVDLLQRRDYSNESIRELGFQCSDDLQSFGSKLKYNWGQFLKLFRIFKPLGYTIAVLGTDGSGKSFIINHITPILNSGFHNGVKYEHMRPNFLPSLAVAIGKKKVSKEEHKECSNPHASIPSGLIGSIIRLSYYWLDYTWGYFYKVFLDKSVKTHVWLFDRYYYDYYIDQRRARLNMPSWIIKLYGWFIPVPDLTICLGGDPVKIYSRKPETSLEEVTRQTRALQDFAKKHKRTIWVDTTVEPQDSINAVMGAIIEMMSKRFKI